MSCHISLHHVYGHIIQEAAYDANSGSLRESIARVAQEQCSCNITATSLEDSYLNCSGDGSGVVFTTTVVYSTDSGDITASDVINSIKQWADINSARHASVMIGGEAAMINQVCSPSCNETEMTEEYPTTVTTESSTAEPTQKETNSPSNTAATTAEIPIGGPTTADSVPEPTEKETISPSNSAATTAGIFIGGFIAGIVVLAIPVAIAW